MIRISNIKIRENILDKEIIKFVCKKYHLKLDDVISWSIFKKSIDARNKEDIYFNYTIDIEYLNENKLYNKFTKVELPKLEQIKVTRKSSMSPVIVGAGPAGLFAALILAKYGIKPIIIEQGKKVEQRKKDVEEFIHKGKLNINSNVQFGEGGAGTFSDGKLTTGIHNPKCRIVLEEFYKFGAPKEILYQNKPHIGTDNLIKIIKNMREEIIRLGGKFLFETKMTDLIFENSKIKGVICNDGTIIYTDTVVLAIGHSARDTFKMLQNKNIKMERKNFSVGVRIEHLQTMINEAQYSSNLKLKLPPAEYKLVYHGSSRDAYTFCMCPGGVVMPSSSEENTIVTNGMSYFARDGENANSALLVNVLPSDFIGDDTLAGMYFQKDLEEKAFK